MRGALAVLLMWTIVMLFILVCIYQPVLLLIFCGICVVVLFSCAGYEKWK